MKQPSRIDGGDTDAHEIDVEMTAGLGRRSELPAPQSGKVWYRRSDGELVQLTPTQREFAMRNMREQGVQVAQQLDDSGNLLPNPVVACSSGSAAPSESMLWCTVS